MATKVTIELTDEEVGWLADPGSFTSTPVGAVLERIAVALPTPLKVGDRVAIKGTLDGIDRHVTWVDPLSDIIHYRSEVASLGFWAAKHCSANDLVKIDDDDEAQ